MGEFTEKVKGNANEAIGEAKQKSDDQRIREAGKVQEAKGKAQQFKGEVEGKLGNDI